MPRNADDRKMSTAGMKPAQRHPQQFHSVDEINAAQRAKVTAKRPAAHAPKYTERELQMRVEALRRAGLL